MTRRPELTPSQALWARWQLDGELHGHTHAGNLRFFAEYSRLVELEERRQRGEPTYVDVISPDIEPERPALLFPRR
jgi:hypothetical protein